jgi:glyoxylase-like metal-dependent hydrolase (beta-lactamase superfamily II)
MPRSYFSCSNCGHWQRYFATPPDCPVCTDTRNDLPEDGWDFRTEQQVAGILAGSWRPLARDMVAFTTAPRYGLNGTGWLLLHPEGNIAFEAAPYYTPPMLDEIRRLGGIRILAASHVHGYGALWQLQREFEPEVMAIQREDLRMTKAFRVNWPYDAVLHLPTGQTLYHVGGHYEGQAVLHDPARRTLFCGDAFKIDQDERGENLAVSSHKAFHKDIPLTPDELRRYREVIAPLDFDTVCTPFEYAPGITAAIACAVLDDGIEGPPGVRRIPMAELHRRSREAA